MHPEVGDGSVFSVGETEIRVLFTPCPLWAMCAIVADGRHVFTGDTMLFGLGKFLAEHQADDGGI